MAITKITVKNYLDGNKDLLDKLKDNIIHKDEFDTFKTKLTDVIARFANNSTRENYQAITDLVDRNYLGNSTIARDVVDSIFKGMGISTKFKGKAEESKKSRLGVSEEEIRKIYESFGVDYDIEQKIEKKAENARLQKLRN